MSFAIRHTAFQTVLGDDPDGFDRLVGSIEELREVLIIDREYSRTTGGRLIVASIEVWLEMLVMRFTEVGLTGSLSIPVLRDDCATRYRFAGGGSTGTPHIRVNSIVFRPTLDPRANRLWLRPDQEQQIEIALPPRRTPRGE
jgi:hypothetical protein